MGKSNRRQDKYEHFTKMIRPMMLTDAWKALSPTAQALYPWIKFEWKGEKANNNGKISLSVRQAADCLGVTKDTAARAFQDLQAKGFLVVTEAASLGVHGHGKCFKYEITEIARPPNRVGSRLYKSWSQGNDFEVVKAVAANPTGRRVKSLHSVADGPIIDFRTIRSSLS